MDYYLKWNLIISGIFFALFGFGMLLIYLDILDKMLSFYFGGFLILVIWYLQNYANDHRPNNNGGDK